MKRPFRQAVAALVALLLLSAPALAAEENILDALRKTLQNDVASITLYNPTESFSEYGELMFNERDGILELEIGAEDISELTEALRVDPADVTSPAADDEQSGEDGEDPADTELEGEAAEDAEAQTAQQPVVPEGYALVRITTKSRDAVLLCVKEEYAETMAERDAREQAEAEAAAAAEAALEAANEASQEEIVETPVPEQPSPTPLVLPQNEKRSLLDRMDEMTSGEIILLIAALIILLVAVAELGVILSLRSRAENVAKNYIRTRAALDKTKRELTAAKSKNLALERELLQEKNKLSAIKQQFERMGGKKSAAPGETAKKTATKPATKPAAKPVKKADSEKTLPDLDYLKWTL